MGGMGHRVLMSLKKAWIFFEGKEFVFFSSCHPLIFNKAEYRLV